MPNEKLMFLLLSKKHFVNDFIIELNSGFELEMSEKNRNQGCGILMCISSS